MPIIRRIPAKIINPNNTTGTDPNIRRVAGYARVSTDSDEQFTSYQAQIDYYTSYIKGHPGWEFVEVYTDEGISGTSTKRREGFKRMIADALDGKIDLIVTKSVSRFARNTVDSLTTIRKLKEKHVECFFEKENIWTFDGKGELLITIMSSIAQEESRSISENVTWSKRKQVQAGKVSLAYSQFLGYDRGPNGELVINEKQAETVRLIFSLFLQGKSPNNIATILTEMKIPTPAGKAKWHDQRVVGILQNEKYIGDALLQKQFTVDFLTHKMKVNEGEVPQVYIEEHHEPIISREVYAYVQTEFERRKAMPGRQSHKRMLSRKIRCAQCGTWYGKKIWHANTSQQKVVWQCNGKYDKSHETCTSGNLTKHEVQRMFMVAIQKLLASSSTILETQQLMYDAVFDTSDLQKERTQLLAEIDITAELMDKLLLESTSQVFEDDIYNPEYEALQKRYNESKKRELELDEMIQNKMAKKAVATEFFKKIKNRKKNILKFDIDLWNGLLDHIEVHSPRDMRFLFRDGTVIKIDMVEEDKNLPALTKKQKEKIAQLRRDGMTYNKIASKMGLTQGQVRSFCLSRTAETSTGNSKKGEQSVCKTCGKKLVHTPGYRKKMFCSDGCRRDWWNRFGKLNTGENWATYSIVCQHCGKTFVTYGKNRKYCCRECFNKSRWHKPIQ
jgi:DNA invertase Pin-like site-specific DNA recombinase